MKSFTRSALVSAVRPSIGALVLGTSFASPVSAAENLTVAAAANFVFALDDLHAAFAEAEPAVGLTISTGSSGGLATQIWNGAPFDVYLSADLDYPRSLIAAQAAVADSLRVFAVGRLVLWTTTPRVELDSIADTVQAPAVRHLAIANTETAPYGRAAREVLTHLDLWDALQRKIVFGESVSQAAQYVETGNAQAGLVALSLLMSPQLKERGRWLEVPPELYAQLEHGVIITAHGADNPAAKRFVDFLSSEPAREVLQRFGYQVPPEN